MDAIQNTLKGLNWLVATAETQQPTCSLASTLNTYGTLRCTAQCLHSVWGEILGNAIRIQGDLRTSRENRLKVLYLIIFSIWSDPAVCYYTAIFNLQASHITAQIPTLVCIFSSIFPMISNILSFQYCKGWGHSFLGLESLTAGLFHNIRESKNSLLNHFVEWGIKISSVKRSVKGWEVQLLKVKIKQSKVH